MVGLTSTAKTAKEAAAQNATRSEAIIQKLKSAFAKQIDVETVSYSVNPEYRPPRPGDERAPEISGYTATNLVRVTVRQLTDLGRVIDVATDTGANRIQNVQFSLKDKRPLEARAMEDAAKEARRKAEVLASALGLKIVRIVSVTEAGGISQPPPRPMMMAAMERASYAPPIEAGNIEVRSTVTLTAEVAVR